MQKPILQQSRKRKQQRKTINKSRNFRKGIAGHSRSLFYKNLKLFEITLNYQSLCGMVVSGKSGGKEQVIN